MKLGPLGIYYFSYSEFPFPKANRKLVIGWEMNQILKDIKQKKIPDTYLCWFEECRTPAILAQGTVSEVTEWIKIHMPIKFKDPIR